MAASGGPCAWCVLGAPAGCDAATLRRAYLAQAAKRHPDKGGDAGSFQELQAAFGQLMAHAEATATGSRRRSSSSGLLLERSVAECSRCGGGMGAAHRRGGADVQRAGCEARPAAPQPEVPGAEDAEDAEDAERRFLRLAEGHLASARAAWEAGDAGRTERQLGSAIRMFTAALRRDEEEVEDEDKGEGGGAHPPGDGCSSSPTGAAERRGAQGWSRELSPSAVRMRLAGAYALRAQARMSLGRHAVARADIVLAEELSGGAEGQADGEGPLQW